MAKKGIRVFAFCDFCANHVRDRRFCVPRLTRISVYTMGGSTRSAHELKSGVMEVMTSEEFGRCMKKLFLEALSKLEERVRVVEEKITALHKANVSRCFTEIDILDQRGRNNNLRVLNLSEGAGGDTLGEVTNFLRQQTGYELQGHDVSACYRLGRKMDSIRPVLLTFNNCGVRGKILQLRKKLKGTKVIVWEDLTRRRHSLLLYAGGRIGKKNVWSAGGQIYVRVGETVQKVFSEECVDAIAPAMPLGISPMSKK